MRVDGVADYGVAVQIHAEDFAGHLAGCSRRFRASPTIPHSYRQDSGLMNPPR